MVDNRSFCCYDMIGCLSLLLSQGEPSSDMHWIDSMMVWSRTTLKSGFRLQVNLLLGVRASDASDLPMIGYLLELFCKGAPVGATMMMR
jgi:hypothetical protein